MSRKWRNWYQSEVDEEIKRVGSRDKVKHNERSDRLLFLERMMRCVLHLHTSKTTIIMI